MDLRENSAVLEFELANYEKLAHPERYALLLEVDEVDGQMVKSMLYALCALLQHLHLLVAESHIMEHDKKVVEVSTALREINGVHYSISFLQQVQSSLVLVLLDESDGTLVQLGENNWDFILGNPEFLVVVLVKEVILLILGSGCTGPVGCGLANVSSF